MQTGTIKFFNQEKGYGFIIPDDETADVYVHWKGCIDRYIPQAGDTVQFGIKEFADGRRAARKVDLAD